MQTNRTVIILIVSTGLHEQHIIQVYFAHITYKLHIQKYKTIHNVDMEMTPSMSFYERSRRHLTGRRLGYLRLALP